MNLQKWSTDGVAFSPFDRFAHLDPCAPLAATNPNNLSPFWRAYGHSNRGVNYPLEGIMLGSFDSWYKDFSLLVSGSIYRQLTNKYIIRRTVQGRCP